MKTVRIAWTFIAMASLASCSTHSSLKIVASSYPHASTTRPSSWIVPSRLPGSLNGPVSGMTGDDLRNFILGTGKGGSHVRPRSCASFLNCILSGGKTDVTITATADADKLTEDNAGEYGTVAAVVDGIDHDTKGYPFKKHDLYAFIVYPTAGTAPAHWDLQQIEKVQSSYVHSTVAAGLFHECTKGGHLFWDSSTADFLLCGKAPHPAVGTMGMTGRFAPLVMNLIQGLRDGGDDPAWISCASGCCTMAMN